MNFQYRNVPLKELLIERNDESQLLWQNWDTCIAANKELVHQDAKILGHILEMLMDYDDRFNGGRPINPDRLVDLQSLFKKRDSLLQEMESQRNLYIQSH